VSFTLYARLIRLINKSPENANKINRLKNIKSLFVHIMLFILKNIIKKKSDSIYDPIYPSRVLLGLILVTILCLPKDLPTIYADVSITVTKYISKRK
jgi:hypothetical protein